MRGFKRILAVIISAVMALSLVACGSDRADVPFSEATPGTSSPSVSQAATLRVLCWGSTSDEKVVTDAVARFNAKYPNVKVEVTCIPVTDWNDFITKWSIMITSGEAPDVINYGLEAVQMAVSKNLLEPLDSIVGNGVSTEGIAQSLLNGFTINGKLYGIPSNTQTMVMYYNKTLFDSAGVEYPKDGWTWDDFRAACSKLAASGVYAFGLPNTYFQLSPWWSTNGTAPATSDGTKPALNTPEMIESVSFISNLVADRLCPDPISSDVYTMFANGEVAMCGAGRWVLDSWKEAGLNNDNFDCVQWPVSNTDTSSKSSIYGGAAWGVSSSTQHKDLAIALLTYLTADDTMIAAASYGQGIPPTEKLATDPSIMGTTPDNINGLWQAVKEAVPVTCPPFYGDLNKALINALESIWSGSATVEDALNEAQKKVEIALN